MHGSLPRPLGLDQDDILALMSSEDAGPGPARPDKVELMNTWMAEHHPSPPKFQSEPSAETTATDVASMPLEDLDTSMLGDADIAEIANTLGGGPASQALPFGMMGSRGAEEDDEYDSDSRPRDASGGYSGSDTEADEEMVESLNAQPAISELDVSEMCVVS